VRVVEILGKEIDLGLIGGEAWPAPNFREERGAAGFAWRQTAAVSIHENSAALSSGDWCQRCRLPLG
jgi:hypothetical protein